MTAPRIAPKRVPPHPRVMPALVGDRPSGDSMERMRHSETDWMVLGMRKGERTANTPDPRTPPLG